VGSLQATYVSASLSGGSFRDWCDPRALTPAGLKSLLATWREALPDGVFSVLIDGYSGPFSESGHRRKLERFPVARQLTLFEAPIAKRVPRRARSSVDLDAADPRWETAPEPSPFIHPTAPSCALEKRSRSIPHR
jgi:hypothetical protein